MDEKIAEKILEEIRSLKIGQQRIVGEVEVLNSMCKIRYGAKKSRGNADKKQRKMLKKLI